MKPIHVLASVCILATGVSTARSDAISYVNCPAETISSTDLPFCGTAQLRAVTDRLALANIELQYVPNFLTRGAAVYDLQTPLSTPPFSVQFRVTMTCQDASTLDTGWRDVTNTPADNTWAGGFSCPNALGQSATVQLRYDSQHGRLLRCTQQRLKGLCNGGYPW